MKKRKYLPSILIFTFLLGMGTVFSYTNTGKLYNQYQSLWDYRRLHPDIIPSAQALRILSVGHDTTHADILWMRLIQFIGDNIGSGYYLEFTHRILSNIHVLHPRFARAYEVDLLLFPTASPENESEHAEDTRKRLKEGLAYYDAILPKVCDMDKVATIRTMAFGSELWSREDLGNPCLSSYIPYYMAARYDSDLLEKQKAADYYKIASMHDDVPVAARFLGILAFSSKGNYREGALTFALLASSEYDESPYVCQNLAVRLVQDLSEESPWTADWISVLEKEEKTLRLPEARDNPLARATGNCFASLERGIKQIYIGYITEKAAPYPDIDTGIELVELGILDSIPTIQSQSGYTVVLRNGIWRYTEIFPETNTENTKNPTSGE